MKVKQVHKNIGVSIEGVDLSKIDENTFQKIKDLWLQYLIIIFPNQNISDEDHIKFGKKFGELEVHPSLSHRSSKNPEIYRVSNVDENGKIIPNKETSWQYLKQSIQIALLEKFRVMAQFYMESLPQIKVEILYLQICIKHMRI